MGCKKKEIRKIEFSAKTYFLWKDFDSSHSHEINTKFEFR